MPYPKYSQIPQSVFATQKNDERIFIISRRHIIYFIYQQIITILLMLVPVLFFIIGFQGVLTVLASFPIFVDDLIILAIMIYYLSLSTVFMTNWVRYYYTYLIVTDRRVYITKQVGYFYREPYEFTLEEVEECTYRIRGMLGIIFNIGDILVHFSGSAQEDFKLRSVFKANLVSMVISSLADQADQGLSPEERMPKSETIGLLESNEVKKLDSYPLIMNFKRSVRKAQENISKQGSRPKGIRQKFDLWWWTQLKKEHTLYIDYQPQEIRDLAKSKGGSGRKSQKL